jgi:hypothetical protein
MIITRRIVPARLTAKQLKRAAGRGRLPVWPGVKYLTPNLNAIMQDAAAEQARAQASTECIWTRCGGLSVEMNRGNSRSRLHGDHHLKNGVGVKQP